jgi:hypothetical protein
LDTATASGPQIPTSLVDAASASSPDTTQVTRNLCAAAYNVPTFRNQVIHELVDRREHVLAPSFGVDVVAVVWHCLRARRIEAWREVAVLAVYLVAVLLQPGPTLLVAYVSAAVRAPHWRTERRKRKGLTKKDPSTSWSAHYLPVVVLALNAILGPLVYILMVIALMAPNTPVFTARSSDDSAFARVLTILVETTSGVALLILPVVFALITLAVRTVRERMGERIKTSDDLRPVLPLETFGALARLQGPFTPALLRLRRQQLKTHLMYGHDVFLGAGLEHSSWSFATHLRPEKSEDAPREPLLKNDDVIDAIRKGMLGFRKTEAITGDRLSDIVVTDFVYAPSGDPTYVNEPDAREVAVKSDERVRHFLAIRVGSWDDDVIVSTFVRASTHGAILYLEVIVHVLLPVRSSYRKAVTRVERGANRFALLDIPANIARAIPWNTWWLIRSTGVAIREEFAKEGDSHPVFSVRHAAATWRHDHYFQRLDAERYIKTVERRIVSSIKDLLKEKKISADEFASAADQVINNGIMISGGTFMRNNFNTGDDVQQFQAAKSASN